MTAKKTSLLKRTAPAFEVSLTRRKGAPSKPGVAELKAALARAWNLIPAVRLGPAFKQKRVSLNVLLIADDEIARLNERVMRHDGPTDVLSFPMGELDLERDTFHLGDVVASFETARREALARGIACEEELTRYCIHGFLHCMGYDDSTPAQRRALFAVQERALK